MLNELRDTIHENAKAHGFYDDENVNIPEKLMLIVSELGEAMEAYRDNYYADMEGYNNLIYRGIEDEKGTFERSIKNSFDDEVADTLIRLLDLCGYMKIDIDKHVELKMKYNESRPYKHGKIC
jgi:NTP pyrophosphatase (non-canonical NTP hydrolase)